MRMSYFELKRFINNPKNRICFIFIILLIFGLSLFHQLNNQSSDNVVLDNVRMNLQQSQQELEVLEQKVKATPSDSDLSEKLEDVKTEVDIMSKEILALEDNALDTFIDLEHELDLHRLQLISQKGSEEYQEIKTRIDYYDAVKSSGGSPSISINDTEESIFTTFSSMISWLSSTTFFILFTVLVSDLVSRDLESTQVRFYQLMGGKKVSQLLSKLLVAVFVTFFLTILCFLVLLLIKGFLTGFGIWNYPYLLIEGTIVPIWKIGVKTVYIFLISLIFMTSLGQLLSLILKKSILVIGLITVILTGFMTLSMEEWFQPFKAFIPIEYMGYGQIVNDSKYLPDNPIVIATIYLVGLSIVFMLLSCYLYKRYTYRKVGK
ncbi:ABC transporter permease [Streptococcus loxodontisalivarius]|uniref:ABC-2 type transport system permease protein n=1 Tax=Streptococcus loxodontisalivarius TaxID=1349415 RepID=A0ABS2PRD7_9STRE|nr:ABC transporter permease [Streptococcus loxodontisalivarius]MBM7641947.1 ABC-2 type transport system permease protein [Streptococcus loxodontisalivarius]